MNNQQQQVDVKELFALIGEKDLQVRLMGQQIATLTEELQKLREANKPPAREKVETGNA
jgi:uncharacterized coiled-coil protein SlyX